MASLEEKQAMEKNVDGVTEWVNYASLHDKELFCEAMSHTHRTYQQSFTRLCVVWLTYVGQQEYQTDPRNQCSADLGKEFVDCVDKRDIDPYLPFV